MTLAPTANLFVLIDSMMAERFLYLPLVGFLASVVIAIAAIGWPRWAAYGLLGAALAAASARTFARNEGWRSNLTLWTSARDVSPDSFRVHRSLAWMSYLDDPRLERHADLALAEADRATAILDPLAPVDRDKLTYLMAGILTRTKAERVWSDDEPAGRDLYAKALRALEQARAVDQAQNARHRSLELERGKNPAAVADVGQPEIYRNLGTVLPRLGRRDDALAAYRDVLHLDPENRAAYRAIAEEQSLLGRHDDEAITLVQLLVMGETSADLGDRLVSAYRLLDQGGVPAVIPEGDGYKLNPQSPLVHAHVCAAALALGRTALVANRPSRASQARATATAEHCDPGPFDQLWNQFHPASP